MQFGNCRRRHRIEIDDSVASDSELQGKLEHLEKITVCSSWQALVELATLNEMCTKYGLNPEIIRQVSAESGRSRNMKLPKAADIRSRLRDGLGPEGGVGVWAPSLQLACFHRHQLGIHRQT